MNDTPILSHYLNAIEPENKFYINVGASYEFNLDRQMVVESDKTIFFEYNLDKIYNYGNLGPNFKLITERVTPHNLVGLIKEETQRKDPKLLDIDIDGYDWFVVEEFLKNSARQLFWPKLMKRFRRQLNLPSNILMTTLGTLLISMGPA